MHKLEGRPATREMAVSDCDCWFLQHNGWPSSYASWWRRQSYRKKCNPKLISNADQVMNDRIEMLLGLQLSLVAESGPSYQTPEYEGQRGHQGHRAQKESMHDEPSQRSRYLKPPFRGDRGQREPARTRWICREAASIWRNGRRGNSPIGLGEKWRGRTFKVK